jgi:hypothetical protein
MFINGENDLLPQNIQECYHSGVNCPAQDSSVSGKGYIQTGIDPGTKTVPNPFNPSGALPFEGTLLSAKIPRYIVDGPYPLFAGQTVSQTIGWSNYNAMQLEVKHQMGHGLTLDAAYTWSKETDFSEFGEENNQTQDTAVLGQTGWDLVHLKNNVKLGSDDVPQRLITNLVYDLPFGGGHAFNPQNRVTSYLVSGWGFGAVEMDESGYPIEVTGDSTGSLDQRPDRAPGEPLQLPKALQHWYNGKTKVTLPDGRVITPCALCFLKYNPDAFSAPTIPNPTSTGKYLNDTYWLGNAAMDYSGFRAPSINNLNFSLRRSFRVRERVSIDFQANASNLLNHPNFETYTSALGSVNVSASNSTNTALGQGTGSSSYGTHSTTTFDSRQITLQMVVKF